MGATGTTTDFEKSDFGDSDFGLRSFELARSNAGGAGLEMVTERAEEVGGIGGGGGIFPPGVPAPAGGWLVGALVLALASGELATWVPGTFAEGALGSLDPVVVGSLAGALDPVGEVGVVSVVILVVTSQVEDGPISCSWEGTDAE